MLLDLAEQGVSDSFGNWQDFELFSSAMTDVRRKTLEFLKILHKFETL